VIDRSSNIVFVINFIIITIIIIIEFTIAIGDDYNNDNSDDDN